MPRGDKSSYTDKQKRKAEHIEEGYEDRGVSHEEAERRAWATVNKETGGGLALPIWIGYMQKALQNVPVIERETPPGVATHNGDLMYVEYAEGGGVNAINGAAEEKPADAKPGEAKPVEKREEGPKGELF